MAETMQFLVRNVMQHAVASNSLGDTQLSKLESALKNTFLSM
jgi:hypothetical protein